MKTELSIAADDYDNVNTSFDTKAATDICSLNDDDDQSKADDSKKRFLSIAGVSILFAALLLTVALGVILSRRSDSSSTAAFTPERLDADAPSHPQPVEPNILASPTAEPSSIAIPPLEIAPFQSPTESPSQSTSSRRQATVSPTFAPTTAAPTAFPTTNPTVSPTSGPTVSPTSDPSWSPTSSPSADPSGVSTLPPTTSSPSTVSPTWNPTASPSTGPTIFPTTSFPTYTPTLLSNCAIRQRPPPPPLPGKKGIGFTLRDAGQRGSWEENLPRVIALRPHWNYKWGLERIEAQPDDIEFVPMVWGAKNLDVLEERLEEWVIPHVQTGKVKRLLGFNEPDRAQQANMEPIQAMDAWPVLERLNISLTSPSCAHAEGRWMETFMAGVACPESIDWVGVHWYGGTNFWSFRSKMTRIYELHGNRPLLLTEFAPADWNALTPQQNRHSTAAVLDFMKRALPWLEETEWIAGYAWFPFAPDWPAGSSSSLFDQAGNLTAVGRYYASVRAENPMGDQSITDDE